MPPKRKAEDEGPRQQPVRRSTRRTNQSAAEPTVAAPPVAAAKKQKKNAADKPEDTTETTATPTSQKKGGKKTTAARKQAIKDQKPPSPAAENGSSSSSSSSSSNIKSSGAAASGARKTSNNDDDSRSYWLMKAEPETRLENGVDVRFSIDDLKSRTEPEPWDGIRAYAARNNLRAMKKGELAFFYHSNCKEPGIVGTMEIVQEHSPDLSAHDPKAPYYDASSKPGDPKWSVVHVRFRSRFARQIGLKELRDMGRPGQPLENMQMLKQSRLSVSRVAPSEWEYLMEVVEERGGEVKEES